MATATVDLRHNDNLPPRVSNRIALEEDALFSDEDTSSPAVQPPSLPPIAPPAFGTDEALPSYSPSSPRDRNLPAYASHDPYAAPSLRYILYHTTRTTQTLLPVSVFRVEERLKRPGYRVENRSKLKLWRKKADVRLVRVDSEELGHITTEQSSSRRNSTPGKAKSKKDEEEGVTIAEGTFDDSGNTLPWMPRASLSLCDTSPSTETQSSSEMRTAHMKSPNLQDWTLTDANGQEYSWTLIEPLISPLSLALTHKTTSQVHARFNFTRVGTRANLGDAVGMLDILRDSQLQSSPLETDRTTENTENADSGPGTPTILISLSLILAHFKRMGKFCCARSSATSSTTSRSAAESEAAAASAAALAWLMDGQGAGGGVGSGRGNGALGRGVDGRAMSMAYVGF